jgi:hypothetical protein
MADHFDAVADPRHDITDLYVFQKPGDPAKSILILSMNPAAPTLATTFDPAASYEFKIDTNGDAHAEIAFHVVFASTEDGQQTATVYRATDTHAQDAGPVGEVIIHQVPVSFDREARLTTTGAYQFYAGLRSDPFFVDPPGFFNGFQWSGQDVNADKNVFGIVLEVPNSALGTRMPIGVWVRTMAPLHGEFHQMDMAGRPFSTNGFNTTDADLHLFNGTPPAQQRERFFPKYVAAFEAFGYSVAEATRLATEWLPIILPYDYTSTTGYPNGRQLKDDVADMLASLISRGKVTSDGLGPHTDYLDDFPYLGPPH